MGAVQNQCASLHPAQPDQKRMFLHTVKSLKMRPGEVEGGGEFVGSDINNTDSNRTPLQNVLSVSLSQVDITMLTSTSTVGHESSLLCYADIMEHIPPLLAQSWSMKFFSVEKEVPFNQHPQQVVVMKKCAIVNSSSLPQPGDPAVSCRFQCESSTVQFILFQFIMFYFLS